MKKRLKLDELKVQSFITNTDLKEVKGGAGTLADCATQDGCTGIYPSIPVQACGTGTNRYNCPCDIVNNTIRPVCA